MKQFKTSIAILVAGLPFISTKGTAAALDQNLVPTPETLDPVTLRPLNLPGENLFAGHRSHSSHSSHRSSSGGSAYRRPAPAPAPSQVPTPKQPAAPLYPGQGTSQPVDPGRAAPVSPLYQSTKPLPLTTEEKRRLQVMRVQIALTSFGLYTGAVNGVLDKETKEALKRFQLVKGMKADGLMNTDTLNALGVPAVQ